MTTVLAADTSTSINTVAVCRRAPDGAFSVLSETIVECGRLHSERLLATVEWVLAEAGSALSEIDLFAISIGPGSFTGLRIGAATWKGLAFGVDRPLMAVPTLDALCGVYPVHSGLICPMLDARMKEVFGAVYRIEAGRRVPLIAGRACPVEVLLADPALQSARQQQPAVFFGDGARVYRDRILAVVPDAIFAPPHCNAPRAACVAAEALERMDAGCSADPGLAAPVYLRPSQAEQARALKAASV